MGTIPMIFWEPSTVSFLNPYCESTYMKSLLANGRSPVAPVINTRAYFPITNLAIVINCMFEVPS